MDLMQTLDLIFIVMEREFADGEIDDRISQGAVIPPSIFNYHRMPSSEWLTAGMSEPTRVVIKKLWILSFSQ